MRKSRIYSSTGLYHVVIRGVNKQNIFFDECDKLLFLNLMKKYKKKYHIRIHAYCLMENHVHFLIEDLETNISKFMQVLTSVYARVFNKKYDRIGHLFQNRFASEVINNDKYYIQVFRYILQNPENANICKKEKYRWSSYHDYLRKRTFIYKIKIIELFFNLDNLYKFLQEQTFQTFLDIELRPSEKEELKIKKIKEILKSSSTLIPPDLPQKDILFKLRLLKNAGLSVRCIARLTGIMSWLVQKA